MNGKFVGKMLKSCQWWRRKSVLLVWKNRRVIEGEIEGEDLQIASNEPISIHLQLFFIIHVHLDIFICTATFSMEFDRQIFVWKWKNKHCMC